MITKTIAFSLMLTLSLGAADMVLIKGGKFTMGGEAENAFMRLKIAVGYGMVEL